jgi:subtilisin family serine protease
MPRSRRSAPTVPGASSSTSNGNLLSGAAAGNYKSTGGVVRQKPDLTAADGVQTATPGFNTFYGTSAAAPHAAAIAALVREANPG